MGHSKPQESKLKESSQRRLSLWLDPGRAVFCSVLGEEECSSPLEQ